MNRIIDLVMLQMQHELSDKQRDDLENILVKVLSQYELVYKKNEIQIADDYFDKYKIEFIIYEKSKGLSDKTLEQYLKTVSKLFAFLKKDIADIKDVDIRVFLSTYEECRKVSKATLDDMRRNISAFFNYAVDLHYININPCNTIKPIKKPKIIKKKYSKNEMNKLENSTKSLRDKAILLLLRSSGIRVSELVNLDISDINFRDNTCFVYGKGEKEREVCFSDECAVILKEYIKSRTDTDTALFVHKNNGGRLLQGGVEAMVRKLGAKNNIHAHPHKYRRTFATDALEQNMQPHFVASLLGHSSTKTTMDFYCVNDVKKAKKAYKKLKL